MNDIEEYKSLIELFKQALKFYANKNNYEVNIPQNNVLFSYAEMDNGAQARFALEKAKQLEELNKKMQNDYNKIVDEGLSTWSEDEQMINDNKIIKNEK
jgi:hypothetical protein